MNRKQINQKNHTRVHPNSKTQRRKERMKSRNRILIIFFLIGLSLAGFLGFSLGKHIKASPLEKNEIVSGRSVSLNSKKSTPNLQNNKSTSISNFKDWRLILVNPWHKMPASYLVTLKQLKNGQAIDKRCYPDLQQMMDDCRANGLSPLICSSYRSWQTQQGLLNDKVKELITQGYSNDKAKTEAAKVVALPGTSEHQLGLALDIVDVNNQNLDTNQENTPVQQWLKKNSWKYGFILRYPTAKSKITGIIYEPWHYRYVGKEAARNIYSRGICLEEYLNYNKTYR